MKLPAGVLHATVTALRPGRPDLAAKLAAQLGVRPVAPSPLSVGKTVDEICNINLSPVEILAVRAELRAVQNRLGATTFFEEMSLHWLVQLWERDPPGARRHSRAAASRPPP